MTGSAKSVSEELDDLARQLRQGAGRELREEAAADEELTELLRRRKLTLADATRSAMHRGDRVTIVVAGMSMSHPVMAVGTDYLTLDEGDRVIDVPLAAAVVVVSARSAGGTSGRPAATTFRARLAEHEQEGGSVEVVTTEERISGRMDVVATDHLVIQDPSGDRFYVPLGIVMAVFSRFRPRLN